MDEYISEFLYSNYDSNSDARKLLAWIMIDKTNTFSRITGRLKYAIETKNHLKNKKFHRSLERYKKFYLAHNAPLINGTFSSRKLKSIQISDFRGFGKLSDEDFGIKLNFNKINNIFFAPNGGGKSSLCEALEYQTTGEIKEAGRRKTSVKNYIKRNGKHKITLLDFSGREVLLSKECKFNFIDRNRLQEFSLLGSSDTKFQEKDVLAALVGLERYDEFLSKFVLPQSFNANAFISNRCADDLLSHENTLIKYRNSSRENRMELKQIKINIIDLLGVNCDELKEDYFEKVIKDKLSYTRKLLSKYSEKKEQLKKGIPSIEVPIDKARHKIFLLLKAIERKERINKKLEEIVYNDDVINLHRISKKILELSGHDSCPLCNTPLEKVEKNPLDNSNEILNSFIQVTKLQRLLKRTNSHNQTIKELIQKYISDFQLSPLNDMIKYDVPKLLEISSNFNKMNDDGIKDALAFLDSILIDSRDTLELYNEKSVQHNHVIKNIDGTLKDLNTKTERLTTKINAIRDQFAIYESKKQNKEKKIIAFNNIIEIIKSAKEKCISEKEQNDFLKALNTDYAIFYQKAKEFKRTKELQILAGIESSIVHYYNEINKHDDDSEKLDSISFVHDSSLDSYRLQLNINGEQSDAFVKLSEGHLKSLGLSILLALAKKKNSQFIVFDDVVNAIDTEHRSNIINTFLTDSYIKNVQKIITTHDKLFWELYSNREKILGNGEFSSFILNCYSHGIHYEERDISFEGKIIDSLEHYDIRQALIYCRIWFESLASKHCVDNGLTVTASFSNRDYQKPNFIKISLEKMYATLIDSLGEKLENINVIKNDFLSWGVQNQEHHAFSENNYNVIHSKTSQEIQNIFDSIRKFDIQLAPQLRLESLEGKLTALEGRITSYTARIANANQATPVDVVRQWNNDKSKLVKEKNKIQELKEYCEACLL